MMIRKFSIVCALLILAACGGDATEDAPVVLDMQGEGESDMTQASDMSSDDMGADLQSQPDLVGSGDMGFDAEVDMEPLGARLEIIADRHWVGLDLQNDSVALECVYIDEDGTIGADPGDLELDIAADEATLVDGRWEFSDYGVFEATCASATLGLETSYDVVVNFDPVSWEFYEGARILDQAAVHHRAALTSYASGDVQAHADAVTELDYLAGIFPDLTNVPWIADHPHGPWPDAQDLTDAGLTVAPEDAQWIAAVDDVAAAAEAERDFWMNLDVSTAQDAELAQITSARQTTRAAIATMHGFEVSTHTAFVERERLGSALMTALDAGRLSNEKLLAFYRENQPQAPQPGGLTVLETMVRIGIEVALTEASSALGGSSYTDILRDVGMQAVASFISIALKDLINSLIQPGPGAPVLESVHGSAAGFVGSGLSFIAYGTFPGGPSQNVMIFIPPRVSQLLATVVDKITSVRDAIDSTRVALAAQEIERVVQAVYAIKGMIDEFGDIEEARTHIYLTPESGDEMFLQYPVLPPKTNCNRFSVPVAGTMIPVNLVEGPGEAINVNVLGENCSY